MPLTRLQGWEVKEEHAAEAAGSSSVSVSQASGEHTAEAGAAEEARTPARVVVLSPEGPREAEPATG